jgi:guanylate kinase
MKTKIIAIVGNSGVGKTYMANHLEEEYGIPMIESRTTRPPRHKGEKGHTFVTDAEFDTYEKDWMIAYTKFGDNRYCCLHSDIVAPVSTYVIDEFGLKYLRDNFSDLYDIFAVRLFMSDTNKHKTLVSEERMLRDEGKFTMGIEEFDYFIDTSLFEANERKYMKMLIRMYQHFDK